MKRLIALSLGIAFPVETHLLKKRVILCEFIRSLRWWEYNWSCIRLLDAWLDLCVRMGASMLMFPLRTRDKMKLFIHLISFQVFIPITSIAHSCNVFKSSLPPRNHSITIEHPVEIFPTSSTFHVPDTLNVTASLLISTVITSLYSHVYLFCLYQWNEIRIGTSEWVIGNWKNIVTITESLL